MSSGVPAATIDVGAVTATPGKATDAAKLVDWKRDGNGDYEFPLVELEAATESDGADPPVDIPIVRDAINLSQTEVRSGVLVGGYEQIVEQDDTEEKVFVITSVMDFSGLPGFAEGTAPTGDDDPDLQIPYHSGGATDFKLNSGPCDGGA